jgi:hypothetical protein
MSPTPSPDKLVTTDPRVNPSLFSEVIGGAIEDHQIGVIGTSPNTFAFLAGIRRRISRTTGGTQLLTRPSFRRRRESKST